MTFAAIVERVRGEYMEMPGLELTTPQAGRLWNLGPDDCRQVLDALVDAGFLKWTAKRTAVRTGRDLPARARDRETLDISVRVAKKYNRTV